jgi:hypothetical protein
MIVVDYNPSDVVPLADFPLAWRITDERWTRLPDAVLARIKPLSAAAGRRILERSPFRELLSVRPDLGDLRATRRTSLEDDDAVKTWLRGLPIDPRGDVYLCWSTMDGAVVVTDWDAFVESWDDFWYPFDCLFLFDESHSWLVAFGPEEEAGFLGPQAGRSSSTDSTRTVAPPSVRH